MFVVYEQTSIVINYGHLLSCELTCVAVDGTCVAVEQEDVARDESCVEEDQEPDGPIPQPILYIHPKTEMTSYGAEQTEAN